MKNILTALVLFASFSASAQTYVGIKAGPSFGRAKNKLGTKDDFGLGFSTGAFIEHGYGKGLLVGAELLFENRITKVPFVHTDNLGNPISAPGKIESIYSAISLPIYVGFKSKLKTVYICATAGIIPAYMPNTALKYSGFDTARLNGTYKSSKSYFDISPMVNLGAGVSFKRLQIGLSGRYQQSIIGITNAGVKTNSITGFISVGLKL